MTKPLALVHGHRRVFRRGRTRRYALQHAIGIRAWCVRVLCAKAINIEIRAREFPKFAAAEDSAVSFPRRNRVSVDLLSRRVYFEAPPSIDRSYGQFAVLSDRQGSQ